MDKARSNTYFSAGNRLGSHRDSELLQRFVRINLDDNEIIEADDEPESGKPSTDPASKTDPGPTAGEPDKKEHDTIQRQQSQDQQQQTGKAIKTKKLTSTINKYF